MAAASSRVSLAFHWRGYQSKDIDTVSVRHIALKVKNCADSIIVRINDGMASAERALPFMISPSRLPGKEVKAYSFTLTVEMLHALELSVRVLRLTVDPTAKIISGLEDSKVNLSLPKGGLRPDGRYHILFTSEQTLEFKAELIEEGEKSYDDYFSSHLEMYSTVLGDAEGPDILEDYMQKLATELLGLPQEKLGQLCNVAVQAYQRSKQAESLEEIELEAYTSLGETLAVMAALNSTLAEQQGKLTLKLDPNKKPTFFQTLQIMVRQEVKDRMPEDLFETVAAKAKDIFYTTPNGAETIERVVENIRKNEGKDEAPRVPAAAPRKVLGSLPRFVL